MKKRVSTFVMVLAVAITILGFSLPAFAQSNVDLRQEVFTLLNDMSNVRDGETWSRWNNQWERVIELKFNSGPSDAFGDGYDGNIDSFAFGQVVEIPKSPANWDYVDWEDVPHAARPSFALAHACMLMTGRYYPDGSLAWDANDDLKRFEAANIAARTIELVFEVVLNTASYSRPDCPLAMEAFHGDPEVFKDLIERQAARHDEVVAELRDAIRALEARPDFSGDVRALIREDLTLRMEFQSEMSAIVRDINTRWDELKSEVGSLWIVLAEFDDKLEDLRRDVLNEVWALCAQGACRGEQGPEGPRGLQGPQGPAGRDADWDVFHQMMAEMEGDFVTHVALGAELENYVTRPEFVADQNRQDDEIAALWAAINSLINSGSATSVTVTGDFGYDNPLAQADCGLWFSATTSGHREVTLATHSGYRGDMSIQFGRYADVEIVSYQFPNGWNTGQESSQPGTKETRWYESAPSTNAQVTAVARYGGATCSVTWNVYHR